jgi:hypothetical protein
MTSAVACVCRPAWWLALWLLVLPAWVGAQATDAAPPDPFYRRASDCVAVMKRDVSGLKIRHDAGAVQVRPQMLRLTELGFTFIGTAYKRGLRKEQADVLLLEAEKAQKTMSTDGLRRLSTECQAEGGKLLAKANVIERALVTNRAKARVEDLLAPRHS